MMDGAVRGARLEDAERILEIYACYVRQTAVTFEYEVPTLEEFRSRMEHTMERYPYLVIEAGGAVQGYAYAGPLKERAAYDWSCETTIYLDRGARRRGLAGGGGPVPYQRQRGVPPPYGVPDRGGVPLLRLQVRPLVSHGLDGEGHRGAAAGPAAGRTLSGIPRL